MLGRWCGRRLPVRRQQFDVAFGVEQDGDVLPAVESTQVGGVGGRCTAPAVAPTTCGRLRRSGCRSGVLLVVEEHPRPDPRLGDDSETVAISVRTSEGVRIVRRAVPLSRVNPTAALAERVSMTRASLTRRDPESTPIAITWVGSTPGQSGPRAGEEPGTPISSSAAWRVVGECTGQDFGDQWRSVGLPRAWV